MGLDSVFVCVCVCGVCVWVCVGVCGCGCVCCSFDPATCPHAALCSSTVDIPSVSACCSMGLPVPAFRDTVDSDMVWCVVMDLASVCVCCSIYPSQERDPMGRHIPTFTILLTLTSSGVSGPHQSVCIAVSTCHKGGPSAILLTMTCCPSPLCVCVSVLQHVHVTRAGLQRYC